MHDRDTLLASVDLRALADELLGATGTGRTSRSWPCPNPNHHQTGRTPPVSVFTSRRGDQRWRCHGCGDGGTAIDLLIAVRGGSVADAMASLAQRTGTPLTSASTSSFTRRAGPARAQNGCADPDGLAAYVNDCATRIWTPSGTHHLQWLTEDRGLPAEVLRRNRIGSDPGSRLQRRPNGLPRHGGIVLPVIDNRHIVYAQVRVVDQAAEGPRYLNPRTDLAPNPRIARIRPTTATHPEVIVTEGTIDALSAAAAGYRAVAVLSATIGDEAVATHLARLQWPLVLAFDGDDAGQAGAHRLGALLQAHGRPASTLELPPGSDLNDQLLTSADWSRDLAGQISAARPQVGIAAPAR